MENLPMLINAFLIFGLDFFFMENVAFMSEIPILRHATLEELLAKDFLKSEVGEEEELRSPEEAIVNRVYVRKTSLATPKGNGVRCRTTSPFAESRHYISNI